MWTPVHPTIVLCWQGSLWDFQTSSSHCSLLPGYRLGHCALWTRHLHWSCRCVCACMISVELCTYVCFPLYDRGECDFCTQVRRVLYNYISCGFADKLPVVNSNLSWLVTMATTDVHKQWLVDETLAILSLQVTASTRWRSKITLLLLDIGLCPSLSTWLSRSRPRWVSIQTHTQDGYRFKF